MKSQVSIAGNNEKTEDKSIGIIAYLTLIGLVAAFIMNKDKNNEFATYHIKQSLGLCLVGFAIFIVGLIPILGWIISFLGSLFLLVFWIMGLLNAINGKEKPVPALGNKFESWFKNM
ncbi:hypothetical protein APR41_12460 [Salegentibacter salinarum]|uniref:Import component protein n=1 Tax=Salegentibacter salinarum TaxID=447422 RepID=A0A2N0U1S7_9FLAO|nr:hypothetical protein [Salegentibacter salinarum]PKD20848.1 hypothetical protein APR41_12460 [Salegentibacter salinarum]SKB78614.1 Uncharacterized membrane protein [Salegentibacter salinarum]